MRVDGISELAKGKDYRILCKEVGLPAEKVRPFPAEGRGITVTF
jgi:hypothetical protein